MLYHSFHWIGRSFLLSLLLLLPIAKAADHLDSPSVRVDGSLDINDVYAFQSPANPANVVFVITVNPLAGVLSGTAFSTAAAYELNIDTDGNAAADVIYRFYFSAARQGKQRFVVVPSNGRPATSAQTNQINSVKEGGSVTAGIFDDPFFFDLNGFNNGLNFTGRDFFAGANVGAIVLELPRSTFPGNNIGVWAHTTQRGRQFDRMGRPAINTVLIPASLKNSFNATQPVNDVATFTPTVLASLASLGNNPQRAASLAAVLLPDILTIDTSSSSGFLNGRGLANDVIDIELNLLTNGAVTGDGVNANDKAFLPNFPYLAPAN